MCLWVEVFSWSAVWSRVFLVLQCSIFRAVWCMCHLVYMSDQIIRSGMLRNEHVPYHVEFSCITIIVISITRLNERHCFPYKNSQVYFYFKTISTRSFSFNREKKLQFCVVNIRLDDIRKHKIMCMKCFVVWVRNYGCSKTITDVHKPETKSIMLQPYGTLELYRVIQWRQCCLWIKKLLIDMI